MLNKTKVLIAAYKHQSTSSREDNDIKAFESLINEGNDLAITYLNLIRGVIDTLDKKYRLNNNVSRDKSRIQEVWDEVHDINLAKALLVAYGFSWEEDFYGIYNNYLPTFVYESAVLVRFNENKNHRRIFKVFDIDIKVNKALITAFSDLVKKGVISINLDIDSIYRVTRINRNNTHDLIKLINHTGDTYQELACLGYDRASYLLGLSRTPLKLPNLCNKPMWIKGVKDSIPFKSCREDADIFNKTSSRTLRRILYKRNVNLDSNYITDPFNPLGDDIPEFSVLINTKGKYEGPDIFHNTTKSYEEYLSLIKSKELDIYKDYIAI